MCAADQSDGEAGATATGGRGVGVGHGKAGAFQTFGVVHATPNQILQTHGIDHHGHAALLDHGIPVVDLFVKGETVLETGAAPPQ